MQRIIDAERSDLFDVLAHVAYALPPVTREARATMARGEIPAHFNDRQQAFIDSVLSHYVRVGVEELDQEKLTPLLRLKYHDSIADALADLGRAAGLRRVPEVPLSGPARSPQPDQRVGVKAAGTSSGPVRRKSPAMARTERRRRVDF